MKSRPMNRREVLAMTGAGLATALSARRLWAQNMAASGYAEPDAVVFNAKVYTVEPGAPRAEAFAVKGGRFLAVGSSEDVRKLIGKRTQTFDAQQMTVVPGFIDCHNHAVGDELLYEVIVGNPFEVEIVTLGSIIDKLSAKARQTPPGYWVEGFFFDDTKVKDKRQLNVHDLDKVSGDHPVAVHHRGGHTTYYNSKALQMAGITPSTPNPPGGTFDRDETGALNGRVTDRAEVVFEKVGKRPEYTAAERLQRGRAAMAHISKQFVRYGLTSVHHEHFDGPDALRGIEAIRAQGQLLHRVFFAVTGHQLEDLIESGVQTGLGDEWLRIGGTVEHTADGSFSERTMALSIPYPGMASGYKGNVTETQEVIDAWVLRMHRAGIQVNCHANGDVAIDEVLTALERAQKAFPVADTRPQITHCTLVNDSLIKRIKALGVVPAPFTTYAYYNSDKFHFYGEELMKRSMAYRSFIDAGIIAAAGSDFPPGPFAPLMGMQGMVTRTGWNGETWGPEQRVTVAEALQINTLNGAYASHEEHIKGSISVGKLADYVVLSEDLHIVAHDKIKDIKVVRTVTGGNTVYQA
ncbi:MAG: Amidohydrolase 3 [Gammaproteobacteria bacterium]|nr:Amidohydrolase 3 [Gammaproteobacteria bacterium]